LEGFSKLLFPNVRVEEQVENIEYFLASRFTYKRQKVLLMVPITLKAVPSLEFGKLVVSSESSRAVFAVILQDYFIENPLPGTFAEPAAECGKTVLYRVYQAERS